MPTISFGTLDAENTDKAIGVLEILLSQGFAGIMFAVFARQTLTIVMTTAPLTSFIDILFHWCSSLGTDLQTFYTRTGIWMAVILILLVVFNACFIMKYWVPFN